MPLPDISRPIWMRSAITLNGQPRTSRGQSLSLRPSPTSQRQFAHPVRRGPRKRSAHTAPFARGDRAFQIRRSRLAVADRCSPQGLGGCALTPINPQGGFLHAHSSSRPARTARDRRSTAFITAGIIAWPPAGIALTWASAFSRLPSTEVARRCMRRSISLG